METTCNSYGPTIKRSICYIECISSLGTKPSKPKLHPRCEDIGDFAHGSLRYRSHFLTIASTEPTITTAGTLPSSP